MNPDPLSLANLHDIVEPPVVGPWPPAAGLWWIAGSVAVWAAALVLLYWLRRRRNAYRRQALSELARLRPRLAEPAERPGALAELADLLKRTALAGFPRDEVAHLSGEPWLSFLDRTGRGGDFSTGPGRLVVTVPFDPAAARAVAAHEYDTLLVLAREWISGHRPPG